MAYTFEAGAALWGTMRRELGVLQTYYPDVTYTESKGWFTRTFTVRGPKEALEAWQRYMARLETELNKD